MNGPACKMCNGGIIVKKAVYRMNMVVVVIGYLVLVPSILLFLCCLPLGIPFLLHGEPEKKMPTNPIEALAFMVPSDGAIAVMGGVVGLVGAFFGWLLVMKKTVLKCNGCGVE